MKQKIKSLIYLSLFVCSSVFYNYTLENKQDITENTILEQEADMVVSTFTDLQENNTK